MAATLTLAGTRGSRREELTPIGRETTSAGACGSIQSEELLPGEPRSRGGDEPSHMGPCLVALPTPSTWRKWKALADLILLATEHRLDLQTLISANAGVPVAPPKILLQS